MIRYSCKHELQFIERVGLVTTVPVSLPGLTVELTAYTDVPRERVEWGDLGPAPLRRTCCSYYDHSVRVRSEGVQPWSTWRNAMLREQLTLLGTQSWRELRIALLKLEQLASPSRWHVATIPMRVQEVLD